MKIDYTELAKDWDELSPFEFYQRHKDIIESQQLLTEYETPLDELRYKLIFVDGSKFEGTKSGISRMFRKVGK